MWNDSFPLVPLFPVQDIPRWDMLPDRKSSASYRNRFFRFKNAGRSWHAGSQLFPSG